MLVASLVPRLIMHVRTAPAAPAFYRTILHPAASRGLQHRKQRHQSSAEWQRRRKERQCVSLSVTSACSSMSAYSSASRSPGSEEAAKRQLKWRDVRSQRRQWKDSGKAVGRQWEGSGREGKYKWKAVERLAVGRQWHLGQARARWCRRRAPRRAMGR